MLVAVLLGGTACSGSSDSPDASSGRAGNPTDSASPSGASSPATSTPPPPSDSAAAAQASSESASAASVDALDLPDCMIGSWQAPVTREFGNLGVAQLSGGLVKSATGQLTLEFTADKGYTFTYDQVALQIGGGSIAVSGPVRGTWALKGDTLSTTVRSSAVHATMSLGGSKVEAPGSVSSALRGLPPTQSFVTCTGSGLQFELPSSAGGGTATFDRG